MLRKDRTPLQMIREEKKLSQADLAEWTGLSINTISRLERRVNQIEKMSYEHLRDLATALGVKIEDLVIGKE